jgi:hypothetical protein
MADGDETLLRCAEVCARCAESCERWRARRDGLASAPSDLTPASGGAGPRRRACRGSTILEQHAGGLVSHSQLLHERREAACKCGELRCRQRRQRRDEERRRRLRRSPQDLPTCRRDGDRGSSAIRRRGPADHQAPLRQSFDDRSDRRAIGHRATGELGEGGRIAVPQRVQNVELGGAQAGGDLGLARGQTKCTQNAAKGIHGRQDRGGIRASAGA